MRKIDTVLVTNDDGYDSYGIKLLVSILKKFVKKIYIIAPEKNMSGSSRSITLGKKIKFKKKSKLEWVINGTPTDCIIFGLNYLFKGKKPDFIFSGINAGSNIGDEISYSGTVGAAFEGAIRGIPSLAISQLIKNKNIDQFNVSKKHLFKILPHILKYFCKDNLLLNLNFPCCSLNEVKELKIVKCSNHKKSDEITVNLNKCTFEIGKMNVLKIKVSDDFNELKKNHITLTPISTNLTKNRFIRKKNVNK